MFEKIRLQLRLAIIFIFRFQLIQQAYEVLSDPQERAWYERHREEILKGSQSNYKDESLDVFAYFNSSCYKGFDNDPEGFYGVFAKVFEQLAAEDVEYMESEDEFELIPKFGNSLSSFDEVVAFYGFWESYSTKKSYAWLFPHNINEIRERRVLKIVDKEHKKIQQKARKERNEEIRSLVSFVKKRDKRMIEYRRMLEEKASQNRLKSQQNRLDQIRQRSAQIKEDQKNTKVHKEQEEALKRLEEDYFNQYQEDSDSEYSETDELEEDVDGLKINSEEGSGDEDFNDDLYCVACNKFFNSEKSKTNHDASKKHKQNLELLKVEMNEEEETFKKNTDETEEILSDGQEEVKENGDLSDAKSKSKKSKKKAKKAVEIKSNDEEEAVPLDLVPSDSDDDEDWSSSNIKKGKKAKADVNKTKKKKSSKATEEISPVKVELKAPEPVLVETSISKEEDYDIIKGEETTYNCETCKQVFPSKNKLFNHLKATNHSVYLGQAKQSNSEKPKSKKRK